MHIDALTIYPPLYGGFIAKAGSSVAIVISIAIATSKSMYM